MMSTIDNEETTSYNICLKDSKYSQKLKNKQNKLENEIEYNQNEIKETFKDLDYLVKKKKKVSFKDKKNFVNIIKVESYKKYNSPIEIRKASFNENKKVKENKITNEKKKGPNRKRINDIDEIIYDKDGHFGKFKQKGDFLI